MPCLEAIAMDQPQFVDVDGRRIRHVRLGNRGDPVVMVHGFGSSLEAWSGNQAALAAAGHVVAALDLPGHGESTLDAGSGSLDELASLVLAYMDAVGIARAHLVGHSMGGAVCLAAADREPARVRSLTLIGPAGFGQKINADVIRGLVAARSQDELAPLLRILFADASYVTDRLLDRMVAHKQRAGAVEALMKIAASRYTVTPSGHQLRDVAGTVPTLMIWGGADAMVPPPAPGAFVRDGVSIRVLPHAGHMVQVEAADEVNRLVGEFLGG
jgi:pyruvate dehydrogenase E2 component (dihydrolipoamide acetyltransferase)